MPVHFGDLPSWIASIGTVSAFGTVMIQIRNEQERRREDQQRDLSIQHRAQEMLISAMPGPIDARGVLRDGEGGIITNQFVSRQPWQLFNSNRCFAIDRDRGLRAGAAVFGKRFAQRASQRDPARPLPLCVDD